MAHLTISDDTLARLAARAAARNTTPEAFAATILERAAGGEESVEPAPLTGTAWLQDFDAWIDAVHKNPPAYPPGHVVDVSREAMYEGCGE